MSQLQQPQPTVQKQTARDFPCLFTELVDKYSKLGLKSCETKSGGMLAVVKQLKVLHFIVTVYLNL